MSKTITPQKQTELNKLKDAADALRKEYAATVSQHRQNTVAVGILKGRKEAATRAYTEAYRALGLNRQSAWQVDRVSRGLCRLCGLKALPGRKHCSEHEEKIKNSFKGGKK
jgi:hypothetical protein